ncbi:MAG: hypothetical protein C4312_05415, partial [Thermoflexus sp.]
MSLRFRARTASPRGVPPWGWLAGLGGLALLMLIAVGLWKGRPAVPCQPATAAAPFALPTFRLAPLDPSATVQVAVLPFAEPDATLREALNRLPPTLQPMGPYYALRFCSPVPGPLRLTVYIPDGLQPWTLADLWGWTGTGWVWLGGQRDEAQGLLTSETSVAPRYVIVTAARVPVPAFGAILEPGTSPDARALEVVSEVGIAGLTLGLGGRLMGEVSALPRPDPQGRYVTWLTVRNHLPGGAPNAAALAALLASPAVYEAHVQEILRLVLERGDNGVLVDYRGVTPDQREAFLDFIARLSRALHDQGKVLAVAAPLPLPGGQGRFLPEG